MNTKIFIFSFFLLSSMAFFGQRNRVDYLPTFDDKKLHYGIYLGLNQSNYKVNIAENIFDAKEGDIFSDETTGFNVGLIADLRLHKNLNLRFEPGLVTNTRTLFFNHFIPSIDQLDNLAGFTREVNSTYFHAPLLLKFSTNRLKNIRPYVLGGVSFDYNFSSNQEGDDNFAGQFRTQTSNFMYEVGIGIDIYLYYFKFSPSIRGIFAINNEVQYDRPANGASQWTDPIGYLGTRGLFLNFAFE